MYIELDYEQIDKIVLTEMKRLYEYAKDQLDKYEPNYSSLKPYELDDYLDCKNLHEYSRYLIRYYSTFEDANAYFDSLQVKEGM